MSFYDFYAQRKVTGISRWLNGRFARRMASKARTLLHGGGAVLEIGTGDGRIARILHSDYSYSGYEPNPVLVSRLREEGIAVTQQFVPPLQEKNESQNVVIAIHVLEHMADLRSAQALLNEINRVLVPGGSLIIACPDYTDFGTVFFDADYSHNFITTFYRLTQLSIDSGFTIVERHFIFGALKYFPGVFMNYGVKLFYFFLRPFRNVLSCEPLFAAKFQGAFARSVYFVCRKR